MSISSMQVDHSSVQMTTRRVEVAVNVRPLMGLEKERPTCLEIHETSNECPVVVVKQPVTVQSSNMRQNDYTCDYVYGLDANPLGRMLALCNRPVEGLFDGFNSTIFAYGQTGSGKTFTMDAVSKEVFRLLVMHTARYPDATIRVSFVEIYQDKNHAQDEIRDLLDKERLDKSSSRLPTVQIREPRPGSWVLGNCIEEDVHSQPDMQQYMQYLHEKGCQAREVADHNQNKTSSRSHAVFIISVERRTARSGHLKAKLHLVDLAGSENSRKTGTQGRMFREGVNINSSLLQLGLVITALANKKGHVPYRNSVLTKLLADSLGGNSNTLMIACVSPAECNREETKSTLLYAQRARKIENKPVKNVAVDAVELKEELRLHREAVARMRASQHSAEQHIRQLEMESVGREQRLCEAGTTLERMREVIRGQGCEIQQLRGELLHREQQQQLLLSGDAATELLQKELLRQHERIEDLQLTAAAEKQRVRRLEADIATKQQHIERLEWEADEQLQHQSVAGSVLKERIQRLEGELAAKAEQVARLAAGSATDRGTIEFLEAEKGAQLDQIQQLAEQLAAQREREEVHVDRNLDLSAELAARQGCVEQLEAAACEREGQLERLAAHCKGLEADRAAGQEIVKQLTAQLAMQRQQVGRLEEDGAVKAAEVRELEALLVVRQARVHELEAEVEAGRSDVERLLSQQDADRLQVEEVQAKWAAESGQALVLVKQCMWLKDRSGELQQQSEQLHGLLVKDGEARLCHEAERLQVLKKVVWVMEEQEVQRRDMGGSGWQHMLRALRSRLVDVQAEVKVQKRIHLDASRKRTAELRQLQHRLEGLEAEVEVGALEQLEWDADRLDLQQRIDAQRAAVGGVQLDGADEVQRLLSAEEQVLDVETWEAGGDEEPELMLVGVKRALAAASRLWRQLILVDGWACFEHAIARLQLLQRVHLLQRMVNSTVGRQLEQSPATPHSAPKYRTPLSTRTLPGQLTPVALSMGSNGKQGVHSSSPLTAGDGAENKAPVIAGQVDMAPTGWQQGRHEGRGAGAGSSAADVSSPQGLSFVRMH